MPSPIPFPEHYQRPVVPPTLAATMTPAMGVQILEISARLLACSLYLLEQQTASGASGHALTHLRRAHTEMDEALLWQRRAADARGAES